MSTAMHATILHIYKIVEIKISKTWKAEILLLRQPQDLQCYSGVFINKPLKGHLLTFF